MNYKKIYDSLIRRGLDRNIQDQYVEEHHILPKCMGGENTKDNLVSLTPEEHFLAHQLLVKIYPNNYALVKAANMMCYSVNDKIGKKDRSNNKRYGWIRKKLYKKVPTKCKCCGKVKMVLPCKVRPYCDIKCRAEHRKIKHICKGCGVMFYKAKSYSTVYCDERCRKKHTKRKEKKCEQCGKNFSKKGNQKFCGRSCANKHKSTRKNIYTCLFCGGKMKKRCLQIPKFCNSYCNTEYEKINSKKVILNCQICSKKFSTFQPEKRKCCSIECLKESRLFQKECGRCGNIFKTSIKNPKKYCCERIFFRKYVETCLECGVEFEKQHEKNKFCSNTCSIKNRKKLNNKICKRCSKPFDTMGLKRLNCFKCEKPRSKNTSSVVLNSNL